MKRKPSVSMIVHSSRVPRDTAKYPQTTCPQLVGRSSLGFRSATLFVVTLQFSVALVGSGWYYGSQNTEPKVQASIFKSRNRTGRHPRGEGAREDLDPIMSTKKEELKAMKTKERQFRMTGVARSCALGWVVVFFLGSAWLSTALARNRAEESRSSQEIYNTARLSTPSSSTLPSNPVLLTNEVVGDGRLEVTVGDFGAHGTDLFPWEDSFDPGEDPDTGDNPGPEAPAFMDISFLHINNDKVAFTQHPTPGSRYNFPGPGPSAGGPSAYTLTLTQPNTVGDLPESTNSVFTVTGNGVDLEIALTQTVGVGGPGPSGAPAAFLERTYTITNRLNQSFEDVILVRHLDMDLTWVPRDPDFFQAARSAWTI